MKKILAFLQNSNQYKHLMAQKPVGSTIHIPKRQFIGESRELDKKVDQTIDRELENIILK